MKAHNILTWLIEWYQFNCFSKSEETIRIFIDTVDNPGWFITINLLGTALEGVTDEGEQQDNSIEEDVLYYYNDGKLTPVPSLIETKQDWFFYEIKNNLYRASGDSLKLEFLLLRFCELFDRKNKKESEHIEPSQSLNWLMSWYASHCNGDWEHENQIKISTLDNPGWRLQIDLVDTTT
ncbi:MAG: hypothetical protein IPP74_07360 [Alphaproteobacteria bacterium]|nr:hypothetical protein [Alphaproteobacteria bacterium]